MTKRKHKTGIIVMRRLDGQFTIRWDTYLSKKALNNWLKYYAIWSVGKRGCAVLSDTTLTVTTAASPDWSQ